MAPKITCSHCIDPTEYPDTKGQEQCLSCNYIILGKLKEGRKYVMTNCVCGGQGFFALKGDALKVKCAYCKQTNVHFLYLSEFVSNRVVMKNVNDHQVYETIRADPCVYLEKVGEYSDLEYWNVKSKSTRPMTSYNKNYRFVMVPCHELFIIPMYSGALERHLNVESPCCRQVFYPDWTHFVGNASGQDIFMGKSKATPREPEVIPHMPQGIDLFSLFCGMYQGKEYPLLEAENHALKAISFDTQVRNRSNNHFKEKDALSLLKDFNRAWTTAGEDNLNTAVTVMKAYASLKREAQELRRLLGEQEPEEMSFYASEKADNQTSRGLRNVFKDGAGVALDLLSTYRRQFPDELFKSHYNLIRRFFKEGGSDWNEAVVHAKIPPFDPEFKGSLNEIAPALFPSEKFARKGTNPAGGPKPGTSKETPNNGQQKPRTSRQTLNDWQRPGTSRETFDDGPGESFRTAMAMAIKAQGQKEQNGAGGKKNGKRTNGQTSRNQSVVIAEVHQESSMNSEQGPSEELSVAASGGGHATSTDGAQRPGTSGQAGVEPLTKPAQATSPQKQNGTGCKKKGELGDGQKSENQAGVPAEIPQLDKGDSEEGLSDPLSAGPSQQKKKLNGAGCKKKEELDDGQNPGTSRQADLLKQPVKEKTPSPQKKQNGSGGKTKGKRSNGQTSGNQPAAVPAEIPQVNQMDSDQTPPEDLSLAASGGGHGPTADDGQRPRTSGQERAQLLNQPAQAQGPSPQREQKGGKRKSVHFEDSPEDPSP